MVAGYLICKRAIYTDIVLHVYEHLAKTWCATSWMNLKTLSVDIVTLSIKNILHLTLTGNPLLQFVILYCKKNLVIMGGPPTPCPPPILTPDTGFIQNFTSLPFQVSLNPALSGTTTVP